MDTTARSRDGRPPDDKAQRCRSIASNRCRPLRRESVFPGCPYRPSHPTCVEARIGLLSIRRRHARRAPWLRCHPAALDRFNPVRPAREARLPPGYREPRGQRISSYGFPFKERRNRNRQSGDSATPGHDLHRTNTRHANHKIGILNGGRGGYAIFGMAVTSAVGRRSRNTPEEDGSQTASLRSEVFVAAYGRSINVNVR